MITNPYVGTLLSMGFLCSILQLSDPIIGFIAGISQFGGCFMYAFASNNWMVYSGKIQSCKIYIIFCIVNSIPI